MKLIDKIGQKTGVVTGGGSVLTGVGTYLDILPGLLGIIASITGIILSVVVIYCTITKSRLEKRLLRDKIAKIEGTPLE